MGQRLELQALLEGLLGAPDVYFQPPANLTMNFPCIVYQRDNARTDFADNTPHRYTQRYQVTLIDRQPDNPVLEKLAALPMCLFNRYFAANNLNHDVFVLYF
jgi:hypothetical protein